MRCQVNTFPVNRVSGKKRELKANGKKKIGKKSKEIGKVNRKIPQAAKKKEKKLSLAVEATRAWGSASDLDFAINSVNWVIAI